MVRGETDKLTHNSHGLVHTVTEDCIEYSSTWKKAQLNL